MKMSRKYSSEKSQKKAQKNSKEKHLLLCDETRGDFKGDLVNLEVASKEKDTEKERKTKRKRKKKKVLDIESGVIEMNHSTKRKNPNKISRNELNSKCEVGSVALHSIENSSVKTNRRPKTSVKNDVISGKNEVTSCLDSHFLKHKKRKKCVSSCDVFDRIEGTDDTGSHSIESEESSDDEMWEEQRVSEDGSCRSVMKSKASTSNDQLVEFRSYNRNYPRFWKKICLELESEGKKFNSGRFSVEEDQQLKKNWKKIIKKCPFESPHVLLFRDIYRDKEKHVFRYIKDTNLYIRLGKHINRPLSASFYRARLLFHPAKLKGRFSPEENTFLLKMVNEYGARWLRIGHLMDRRNDLLASHFRVIKSNYNRGRWTEEEDRQLIGAIKSKAVDRNDSEEFLNLPWTEIAKMVPTRYATQCQKRWGQMLAFGKAGKQRFSKRLKKRLIREIKKQKVNHESEIDWIDLTSKFNNASPQFLENRFRSLRSMMPNYQLHSLDDILDYIEKWLLSQKNFKSKGVGLTSAFE